MGVRLIEEIIRMAELLAGQELLIVASGILLSFIGVMIYARRS
jgi:hypothetical protein